MRTTVIIAILVALAAGICVAQTLPSDAPDASAATTKPNNSTTNPTEAATNPADATDSGDAWSVSVSVYTYFIPDSHEYVQPTITADRDWLHLEARYNYEAQNTGSAWVGYNFAGGEKLAWEITPMLGGVFGDTSGVAIGYKGSLTWRNFELYSEGEYVIDTGDTSDSFFYNWSEVTFAPVEWFRFGIAAQRTRAYQSDRDIQRGLMVGFRYKRLDLAGYLFNPDDDQCIIVIGLRFDF
jgi:hypothetical protein